MLPEDFACRVPLLDSTVPAPVSFARGSGSPHFQQRGGISATAFRSSETKFCAEQAVQASIIGAILPFPAPV
jgi:hypothetical protein